MTHHEMHAATERREVGELGPRLVRLTGLAGVLALGASAAGAALVAKEPARFFQAYLVSFCFFLSLSLGGLFFVMLQHLTRSGWSVALRRLAEVVAVNAVLMVLLFIPVILGMRHLYHWTHAEAAAHDHLLAWKRPYLNVPFFLGRCTFYFALWGVLASYFWRRSVEQDATGEPRLTLRMERLSAPAMVLFGLTITFAAFDLIMSLDAHWFSTIFGVYFFAGSVAGFVSLLALGVIALQRSGRLTQSLTAEHLHDLGKLLFAFVFFWAYIAFSQYMLQWYANLPEETAWYHARQSGPWKWVALALIFGHFAIPFVGLISRVPKRRPAALAFWAVWVLAMHWLDLYWVITPAFHADRVPFGWLDVGCLVGVGGLFVASAVWTAGRASLRPERDPRLDESLAFRNV